ncbi:hypothetical protein [Solitalea canadensis]|uniref:Glycoamylase-like domain-containing protein n=1 Tax=Solitalea canadensis (strain ATCC 29591 / DSM 3403 / JCM 21819 / LMG 8368 / NBRC 15130 / NCIMB 12057 / USAM 9D) TaxID=929556 RepID=H8KRH4_SOLCM|nr:hypothetical protein [Solitalea canadensis]AFD07499.1 hypothetical protein Solca_2459 [Solitalea canadensis DSM 3403]
MKKILSPFIIFSFLFLIVTSCSKNDDPTQVTVKPTPEPPKPVDTVLIISDLFRNSFRVYEMQRNTNGIYRDSKVFNGTDYHPASVANIGIGLVSLCVADKMGWTTDAQQQAITTLNSVLGKSGSFQLDVNAAGFPRHFVDMETGARAWNSEYSTVDAALMVSGAFFCKNYFKQNTTIASLADQLFKSIDWSKAIANPETGAIYLSLDADGKGSSTTAVYNEYMLVAYLAYKAENGTAGPATALWNKFYANPTNLPQSTYLGYSVLTDNPGSFLSDFIPQFCYYLCHPYAVSSQYKGFMTNSMQSDKKWWSLTPGISPYEWGLGAGSSIDGYHADRISDNNGKIVSPHIVAGFIPINEGAKKDLISLYVANKGVYTLPGSSNKILWRYSLSNTSWRANEVQGIDYSTMLFGLASLPENCGANFFSENNNYSFPVYKFEPR